MIITPCTLQTELPARGKKIKSISCLLMINKVVNREGILFLLGAHYAFVNLHRTMKHGVYKMPSVDFFLMHRISDFRSCSSAVLIMLQYITLKPLVMRCSAIKHQEAGWIDTLNSISPIFLF